MHYFSDEIIPGVALPLQRGDKIVKALLTGTTMTPISSDHDTYIDRGAV